MRRNGRTQRAETAPFMAALRTLALWVRKYHALVAERTAPRFSSNRMVSVGATRSVPTNRVNGNLLMALARRSTTPFAIPDSVSPV